MNEMTHAFVGGPINGKIVPHFFAGLQVDKLYLFENEEDESLHLYKFESVSMSEAVWKYVGEVIRPEDQDIIARANAEVKKLSEESIREIVRDEVARIRMTGQANLGQQFFNFKS